MSNWIKWHKDYRGFSHTVMITAKGLIIANYRITRNGAIRRELILLPKRKISNRKEGKIIFEEYYDQIKIKSLIQALNNLTLNISDKNSFEDIISEIEKIITHLNYLKFLFREVRSYGEY